MKKILSTTAILLLGTAAFAQSSDFETRITSQLEADGYTIVEVETDVGEVIVEATRDGVEFEFTYDATSEELLDTEEDAIEEDDDDMDESDEDDDMDDEDEDDEEDEDEDDDEDDDDDGDDDDN